MSIDVKPLQLNYGCGESRLEGYIGVDVRPCPGGDYVLPAWDTSPFEAGSVAEIYSRHMLEHLDPEDARRALSAWLDVLRPGGLLRLIVPDLSFHASQLLGEQMSWTDDSGENLAHAMAGFYGWRDPARGGHREDAHRWGYTWGTLSELLKLIGYIDVVRVRTGRDSDPWHLHVTGHKRGAL